MDRKQLDRREFFIGTAVSLTGLVSYNYFKLKEEFQDDLAKKIVVSIPNIEDFTENIGHKFINLIKIEQYSLWNSNVKKAIDEQMIPNENNLDIELLLSLKKTAEKTADYYSSLYVKIKDYDSRYTPWDKTESEKNKILMKLVKNEFTKACGQLYYTRDLYSHLNQERKNDLVKLVGKVYLDSRKINKEVSSFSTGILVLRNIGIYYS